MSDLFDFVKKNNLPKDFQDYYDKYLDNPILWLVPLNPSIDKSIFNNNDKLLFEINDIIMTNNDIKNIDFYENLLFYPIKDKLIIDIIYKKFNIYYDINNKTVKSTKSLTDLTKLIKFIMEKVLKNNEIIKTTNNLSIENYYKNIYNSLLDNKTKNSNINSFKSLINSKIELPNYSKETAKIYSNVFKEKFNLPKNISVIPPCIIDAVNNNSLDSIYNYKFDINKINKNVKSINSVSNIKCLKFNKINNIDKNDIDNIKDCYKDIKYNSFSKEIYDKLDDKEKEEFIKSACIIGNIDYLLNSK